MMLRGYGVVAVLVFLAGRMVAESAAPAGQFVAADVRVSPPAHFPFSEGALLRGERYTIRQATMVDLITDAYGLDPTNVQGGPSWLERDRFDVVAKVPAGTTKETAKPMLQGLLADRFKLVMHMGEKPMPAWVLTATDAKTKMKESDGSGIGGCVPVPPPANPPAGTPSYVMVQCRNMTMDTLARTLHMFGGEYLTEPVVDETGLKGAWDFDFKWTWKGNLAKQGSDGITIFAAVEKQLGLKLELKTAPRPVMMVDSVSEVPTANAAGTEKILPPLPPAQFDVAVIKPAKPDEHLMLRINGGQVNIQDAPLKLLLKFVWDIDFNDEQRLVGPKWLDTDKFDVLAKVAPDLLVTSQNAGIPPVPIDDLRDMMKAMLYDRFQIKSHVEKQPISAYTLVAVNPKLRKADPASRTKCTEGPGPDGKDPRVTSPVLNRLLTCQNMTLGQISDELQRVANGYIQGTVVDKTGIARSWDFTLSFSSADRVQASAASASGGSDAGASDPNGALSLFDAVRGQLGLKLEKEKRPEPVVVIDQIQETPTEN
jgi:uncharacterized protein (TIGR03435 family)